MLARKLRIWERCIRERLVLPTVKIQAWLAAVSVLFLLGCDVPELPKVVTISNAPNFRPVEPRALKSPEQTMAAVITICRDELNLPVVDPLQLKFYKNAKSFEILVGRHMQTENTAAVAEANKIHINLEIAGTGPWGEKIRLMAHEYAHNVHHQLSRRTDIDNFWFAEGFADWVASQVLHSLGWQTYAVTVQEVWLGLNRHKKLLPRLSWLRDGRRWDELSPKPYAAITTYGVSFAAVDRIIATKGFAAVLQYLKSGNFSESFGESLETFEASFAQSLQKSQYSDSVTFSLPKPGWRIGYAWNYAINRPGSRSTIEKKLLRKDNYQGVETFVLQAGDDELFVAENSLAVMSIFRAGKPVMTVSNPNGFLRWPLRNNEEWRYSSTRKDFENGSTYPVDHMMTVSGMETVQVPAGNIEAAKIESYGYKTGRLLTEYWYSPKFKWFVKSRQYKPDGLHQEELVGAAVD